MRFGDLKRALKFPMPLKFVDDMVKLIEDNYCVDTTRLYANGFSYGGGMSYAIACARAKVFRAVAIYEGAQLSGCDGGNDPIAYWQMAGTTDNTCTIGMATPMRDKFVKNNGCTGPTTEPPRPTSISNPHICTDYTGCSSGHPVRWCVHPAGHGNAIVDGTADPYNSCATPPKSCSDSCKCTWVPEDVWKFFTPFWLAGIDHGTWFGSIEEPVMVDTTGWVRSHLMNDMANRSVFCGSDCKVRSDRKWKVQRKMMDK